MDAQLTSVLTRYMGEVSAAAILRTARARADWHEGRLPAERVTTFLTAVGLGLRTFVADPVQREGCLEALRAVLGRGACECEVAVQGDTDVVRCRTCARELCAALGFSPADQTRVATVVSELARNIVRYAGEGHVELRPLPPGGGRPAGVEVVARDSGPGISNLDSILAGHYQSRTGMGMGLLGSKRLMDELSIETSPGRGTVVRARRRLPTAVAVSA